jgi:hypothetical protein
MSHCGCFPDPASFVILYIGEYENLFFRNNSEVIYKLRIELQNLRYECVCHLFLSFFSPYAIENLLFRQIKKPDQQNNSPALVGGREQIYRAK